MLGTPTPAQDGSGLTQAYEALVHTTSSDGFNTPNAWYLGQGLNPQTFGIGTQDPNGDGLLNWQEYLYGTQPDSLGRICRVGERAKRDERNSMKNQRQKHEEMQ